MTPKEAINIVETASNLCNSIGSTGLDKDLSGVIEVIKVRQDLEKKSLV